MKILRYFFYNSIIGEERISTLDISVRNTKKTPIELQSF